MSLICRINCFFDNCFVFKHYINVESYSLDVTIVRDLLTERFTVSSVSNTQVELLA